MHLGHSLKWGTGRSGRSTAGSDLVSINLLDWGKEKGHSLQVSMESSAREEKRGKSKESSRQLTGFTKGKQTKHWGKGKRCRRARRAGRELLLSEIVKKEVRGR